MLDTIYIFKDEFTDRSGIRHNSKIQPALCLLHIKISIGARLAVLICHEIIHEYHRIVFEFTVEFTA